MTVNTTYLVSVPAERSNILSDPRQRSYHVLVPEICRSQTLRLVALRKAERTKTVVQVRIDDRSTLASSQSIRQEEALRLTLSILCATMALPLYIEADPLHQVIHQFPGRAVEYGNSTGRIHHHAPRPSRAKRCLSLDPQA